MWLALILSTEAAEPLRVSPGHVVQSDGWLLSEGQYNRCLTNSANLKTCQEGLDTLVPQCVESVRELGGVLEQCTRQFDADAARDEQLTKDLHACKEVDAGRQMTIQKLRAQRNTAYIVTGGLALIVGGTIYAAAVTP